MILLIFTKLRTLQFMALMQQRHFCVLLIVGWLLAGLSARSQIQESAPKKKRVFFTGLPIVYYTPETRIAGGVSALCLFAMKNDTSDAYRSSLSLSAIYTQNKQALFSLPFNLFLMNKRYWIYGETSYIRFNYNFYGVGNLNPRAFVERYGVDYPRIRLSVLRQAKKNLYAGIRYAYDNFSLYNLDQNGQLISGVIPGSKGGIVSGFGAILLWDKRNQLFFPTKGSWAELVVYHDDPKTGSTFNYYRITLDLVKYFSVRKNIFALNAYSLYSNTDLPFFQMASLGGVRRMRGFYEGRYRDNNGIVFQAEYRRIVFGPLGFTVFGAIGQVSNRYNLFTGKYWKHTFGAGLRCQIDPRQKIHLRFDLAVGNGQLQPYFTFAEAF